MEPKFYTSSDIQKIFKVDKDTLKELELSGSFPVPERIKKGAISVKAWPISSLPSFGLKCGFFKKPKKRITITVFTQKGGVTKSSYTHCLARVLALNGINVLLIGLDSQLSVTTFTFPGLGLEELRALKPGLYHHFYENASLDEVIRATDIPTLKTIPETSEIKALNEKIERARNKEAFFKEKLMPQLINFDCIIFDNGPSWNNLIENSIVAADTLISPVSCAIGTLNVLPQNLEEIAEFQKDLKLNFDFIMVPTLLDHNNKLSAQIYNEYKNNYPDNLLPFPIRKSVKAEEAQAFNISSIEYDPLSPVSIDYYQSFCELWKRINPEYAN